MLFNMLRPTFGDVLGAVSGVDDVAIPTRRHRTPVVPSPKNTLTTRNAKSLYGHQHLRRRGGRAVGGCLVRHLKALSRASNKMLTGTRTQRLISLTVIVPRTLVSSRHLKKTGRQPQRTAGARRSRTASLVKRPSEEKTLRQRLQLSRRRLRRQVQGHAREAKIAPRVPLPRCKGIPRIPRGVRDAILHHECYVYDCLCQVRVLCKYRRSSLICLVVWPVIHSFVHPGHTLL